MSGTQSELTEEQDRQLDEITEIGKRLKNQGTTINQEIDQQSKHIEELST
jgi:methyl-accepting chemotaxis protein